jgi:hypothetical protein
MNCCLSDEMDGRDDEEVENVRMLVVNMSV